MTPPDDRSGQYGVPYPGTGHDAFGAPGVGHGQPYQQQYAAPAGQQQYFTQPYGDQQPYGVPPEQGHYGTEAGYQDYPGPEPFPEQAPQEPGHVEELEEDADSGPLIRPFAMTGGRTRPRYELAIEALVSASVDPARLASLLPEHQRICTLCTDVKSVAEVSALLGLPLGVARILVADLAEAGLVTIHQPAAGGESGNQPDVTLLERVLSGLRKL
ncbi:DUF742 domain-containing protein [Kitasatospora sp. DSM 101779]|uniref:DUF742 domain-containing protein n=1 Tax=Kitasatospora sp. DSM 101779 TaxID=2853165 RepID=UPI0021D7D7CD|nr:DUF742 domain-containing protein [Kitasatospora sp. DSM 101779]MCU7822717.1 DUF742 domain-containing protein [Kitasatospora sp. DSM 101779]